MSIIGSTECTCSICGATNEYPTLSSTNTFGGTADLDLRPPEMYRGTMDTWLQECPECGYVSAQVSNQSGVTREWLQEEKYVTCDGMASDLAKRFYRYYLICREEDRPGDSFHAILHAAWACDDEGDAEGAVHCRKLALPLADKVIAEKPEDVDTYKLVKADIMRRAGMFEEMVREYAGVRFDGLLDQILAFQIGKAKAKDDACYRISDVKESNTV